MSTVKTAASIARIHISTQLLIDLLKVKEIGTFLTYSELSKVAGCDVCPQGPGYAYLMSAKRIVQREFQKTFVAIPKEGIQMADNQAIIAQAAQYRTSIRRKSDRGMRLLGCCKLDSLTAEQKNAVNAAGTQFSLMRIVCNASSTKQIESAVAVAQQQLPLQQTLAAFGPVKDNGQ